MLNCLECPPGFRQINCLSMPKANFILFGNKRQSTVDNPLRIIIDGNALEQVGHSKFLGVIIDSKLNWKHHINYISLKVSKGLGAICRARHILPLNVLIMLYHTMIYPYLSSCNIVWGAASNTVLGRLIILQKRAVRLITHSRRCSSSTPLFARLHLLKLIDINHFQTIIFMYKLKNNQLPLSCMNYIPITNPDRPYSTCHFHFF